MERFRQPSMPGQMTTTRSHKDAPVETHIKQMSCVHGDRQHLETWKKTDDGGNVEHPIRIVFRGAWGQAAKQWQSWSWWTRRQQVADLALIHTVYS